MRALPSPQSSTARRVRYAVLAAAVVLGLSAYRVLSPSDAARYQKFTREIRGWDSLAYAESLRVELVGRVIADSAAAKVARLTPAQVEAERRQYGEVRFAPAELTREQSIARDRWHWAKAQGKKTRTALDVWLHETPDGRDTLGVRHR